MHDQDKSMSKHLVNEKEGLAKKAKSAMLTLRRLNVERSYFKGNLAEMKIFDFHLANRSL